MGCYQSSGEKEIVHRRARSNMQKYILHNMYDSRRRPTVTELDIMTEKDPLKLRTPHTEKNVCVHTRRTTKKCLFQWSIGPETTPTRAVPAHPFESASSRRL